MAILAPLLLLGACKPPPLGLAPLQQPSTLQAAAPRVSGAIPVDRSKQQGLASEAVPAQPRLLPPAGAAVAQGGDITLNFVDTDIREIARTILGTTLKVNYTIDPNVHGTGSIETTTPLPRAQLLPTLETLLNENGATLSERNGIYNVVPLAAGALRQPISGVGTLGAGTEVVPLHYTAATDLAKVLEPYVAEGGKITADAGRNALIVSGDAAVRRTLVDLVHAFDIDLLAGQSYALFPAGDERPEKLAGEVEKALEAQNGAPLVGLVRVLSMERVNAVLIVTRQPRYIDAARRFFHLMSRFEDATARSWHVYYVQNGQSADLENLLQRAFTPNHVSPTTSAPGSTAPGAPTSSLNAPGSAGGTIAGAAAANALPGTSGAASPTGTTGATGGMGTGLSLPPPPAAPAAGARAATEPLSAETGLGGPEAQNRIRILANERNNALLIYATPSEYSVIEGMLRKIDIVPLQVLIEATIAEVSLNDQLQYGTQFFFKVNHIAETLGQNPSFPTSFAGFALSKAPQFALQALADVTKVKVLSAPELTVLDNQEARLQVGQQVPIETSTAQSFISSGAPIVSSIDYHDTGVIMLVRPHVNSSGLVSLEIAQEVSDVAPPALNTVATSPTFSDQKIITRVAVQDGQTVGMAGLITDKDSQENAGLPWLKDIPVVSTLLSNQNNSRARNELLVLITPHVVRDQRDARALTEDMRRQLIGAGLVPQELERKGPSGSANPNGL